MSWSDLSLDYFAANCLASLGPVMASIHHQGSIPAEGSGVVFQGQATFLAVEYWVEDAPAYRLMAEVGVLERGRNDGAMIGRRGIGVWELIPGRDPARQFQTWTFNSSGSLASVLERFRDEVLVPYVLPTLADHASLARRVEASLADWKATMAREREDQDRRAAAAAFARGDYPTVVSILSRVPQERLTPSDKKRLSIASNRAPHTAPPE